VARRWFLKYVTYVLVMMNMFRTRCMLFYFAKTRWFCELRKHFSFLLRLFFYFSAVQPFLLQQVNDQLVHNILSQQNTRLFLFLSRLMDLFVAGRVQSAADHQTTWLKVTPHCNHCKPCKTCNLNFEDCQNADLTAA
jgi:hypothetical protein